MRTQDAAETVTATAPETQGQKQWRGAFMLKPLHPYCLYPCTSGMVAASLLQLPGP